MSNRIRAHAAPAMPEQVSVLTALLLRGARVSDFSGRHVTVGGRRFLRLHLVAARRALHMAAAARRGYVGKGLVPEGTSLRQYLRGVLAAWFDIRPRGRK